MPKVGDRRVLSVTVSHKRVEAVVLDRKEGTQSGSRDVSLLLTFLLLLARWL